MSEKEYDLSKVPEEVLERLVDEIEDDLREVDSEYSEEELKDEQERFEGIGMNLTLDQVRSNMWLSELAEKGLLDKQDFEEELKRREE